MDLNLLTTHLSEFEKASSSASSTVAQLKPIIEQLQQQQHQTTPAITLQFETRPTACQPSYVVLQEDIKGNEEIPLNKAKGQIPSPPPPPPPSAPAISYQ
ncbi:hypothetical protein DOY81_003222 [Sarcophaga bullata]|nr:hypothetical protein DOY81_003222 [Sarcophaga bullata]